MFVICRVRIAGMKESCFVAYVLCNRVKESVPFSERQISNSSLLHALYCKMAFRNCEDVTGVQIRLMQREQVELVSATSGSSLANCIASYPRLNRFATV
jgi:hypothetical protein